MDRYMPANDVEMRVSRARSGLSEAPKSMKRIDAARNLETNDQKLQALVSFYRVMIRSICLTWPLCLVLMTGCAVGPDFKPPQTDVPTAWVGAPSSATAAISTVTGGPLEFVQWWNSFDDPELTSLVERAIAANLDLRQATARIRQARAARGVGAGSLWPSVNSLAGYTRSGAGSAAGAAGSSRASVAGGSRETDLFQAGLDALWELDVFGGIRRNIEALDADLNAAVEDQRDVMVILTAEVALNYFTLRGTQEQIAIARNNLEAQQKTMEITRQRFEAGFVSGLDLANAKAQAATTASLVPTLESEAIEAIHTLSLLLALEPNALLEELQEAALVAPVPPEVPIGLPSDLLRRRPDIRRTEAQIHAATARIGVATADLFPRFSLTGSLSFSGDTLSSMASWNSRVWSVGPSMQWLIFDAGRIRWNIEVQKAIQEQALLAYRQTVLTALKEVESALVAYAK